MTTETDRDEGRLELSLTRSKAELRRMASALERFTAAHALSAKVSHAVSLALEEAVTNVIFYAFEEVEPGASDAIELTVECVDGSVRAVIRDRGRPFDPTEREAAQVPESLDELEPGGLGITMIRNIADRLDYRREGGYNRLELQFAL